MNAELTLDEIVKAMNEKAWSITTLEEAEIMTFDAPTFEEAYPIGVKVWDALTGPETAHCDGIMMWEYSGAEWWHRLTITYATHER